MKFWKIATISMTLVLSNSVNAADYEIVSLAPFYSQSQNTRTYLEGVNNNGVAVGWSYTVQSGFYNAFTFDGHNLNYLSGSATTGSNATRAYDINDNGLVVGQRNSEGFIYSNGSVSSNGTNTSVAINNSNVLTGDNNIQVSSSNTSHAYIQNGFQINSLHDLDPNSPLTTYRTSSSDINNNGNIVGSAQNGFGTTNRQAYIYDGSNVTGLGSLGGNSSFANGLNDLDIVVGSSRINSSGIEHAFMHDGNTMLDLGTLNSSTSESSFAYAINELGQIVGENQSGGGDKAAFLWDDGEMLDLCLLSDCTLFGWDSLDVAKDINDNGQIVGWGSINGEAQGFILNPVSAVPVPAAVWLFGSGLIGLAGFARRKKA